MNLKKLQGTDFVMTRQTFFGVILMMGIAVEILLILEIVFNVLVLVMIIRLSSICFLSADSLSSTLLVGLSKEGRGRRKEGSRNDYFQSLWKEMGQLKAWGCYSIAVA